MYKQTNHDNEVDNILKCMKPLIIDSKQDIDHILRIMQSIILDAMNKCIPISKSCH